jgi:hypothetical protein
MGNGFVVEAALTLWGVCEIDFVQVVVQVESTRSKTRSGIAGTYVNTFQHADWSDWPPLYTLLYLNGFVCRRG